ncbi:hypothetical protein F5884DRAFT_862071 [Xylogone sp. PMI_703]|nr:hypothetical protein F5884DRAFT_862071 [Xylogone sp. PMI_703]
MNRTQQVLTDAYNQTIEWIQEHPGLATWIAVNGAVIIAPGILWVPALGVVGFGPGGIGAGTWAAGIQSGIGNVAAGSVFATMQSAGAGGAGAAVLNTAVQAGGLLTTAGTGAWSWMRSKF